MGSRILFINGGNGAVRNTIVSIVAKNVPKTASTETAALRVKSLKKMNVRGYRVFTKIQCPATMKMSKNFVGVTPCNVIISKIVALHHRYYTTAFHRFSNA